MPTTSKVTIVIAAKNLATQAISNVREGLGSLASRGFALVVKWAKRAALAITGAFVAALGVAIRQAAEFQTRMAEVGTLISGDSSQAVAQFSQQLLEMSKRIPKTADDLGAGLYQVLSAGVQGASNQLFVLETAAKAAVAGLSDTFTAVDAITTILNAYGLEADRATQVSDLLFQTVKQGKTTFTELASDIGVVAQSASLAGVSFEEVSAILATMTKGGINTAEATTSLNRALVTLISPQKEAQEAARRLGVDWSVNAVRARGLAAVVSDLERATRGDVAALQSIVPEIRAFKTVAVAAGTGAAEFQRQLVNMDNALGSTEEAFQKMNNTAANQWQLVKNNLNKAFIEIGTVALPVVVDALHEASGGFERMSQWAKENEATIIAVTEALTGMVKVLGTVLGKVAEMSAGLINTLRLKLLASRGGSALIDADDEARAIRKAIDAGSTGIGELERRREEVARGQAEAVRKLQQAENDRLGKAGAVLGVYNKAEEAQVQALRHQIVASEFLLKTIDEGIAKIKDADLSNVTQAAQRYREAVTEGEASIARTKASLEVVDNLLSHGGIAFDQDMRDALEAIHDVEEATAGIAKRGTKERTQLELESVANVFAVRKRKLQEIIADERAGAFERAQAQDRLNRLLQLEGRATTGTAAQRLDALRQLQAFELSSTGEITKAQRDALLERHALELQLASATSLQIIANHEAESRSLEEAISSGQRNAQTELRDLIRARKRDLEANLAVSQQQLAVDRERAETLTRIAGAEPVAENKGRIVAEIPAKVEPELSAEDIAKQIEEKAKDLRIRTGKVQVFPDEASIPKELRVEGAQLRIVPEGVEIDLTRAAPLDPEAMAKFAERAGKVIAAQLQQEVNQQLGAVGFSLPGLEAAFQRIEVLQAQLSFSKTAEETKRLQGLIRQELDHTRQSIVSQVEVLQHLGLESEDAQALLLQLAAWQAQLGNDQTQSFWTRLAENIQQGITGVGEFKDLLVDLVSGTLQDFAGAIETAFTAMVEGSASAGTAFAQSMLKALATVARAFGKFFLAQAVAAAAKAIGNPIAGLAEAAKWAAAATAMFAVAGVAEGLAAAAGGGGGGGGGITGPSGPSSQFGQAARGEAVVIIEGGILDMGDPRQADALARALSDLSGRNVTVKGAR